MITANDHIKYIRAKVRELKETIASQQSQAKELGVTIEAIEPIALNQTKRAIVAWYKRATETIKANDTAIAAKQAEIKEDAELRIPQLKKNGVIVNNSDFGQCAVTGTTYHRYWLAQKDGRQDKLLFFRMGDFTWTFAGDAVRSAKASGDKHLGIQSGKGYKVVTWGFPSHATDRYVSILKSKGYQVEILEPAKYFEAG